MQGTDQPDFDRYAWHDDPVYGLALRLGEPAADDWRSDLVLDLDHIVEWVRDGDAVRFRVAPATLVFHGVSDLRVDIDWGMRGWQVAPSPPTIDQIDRATGAGRRAADLPRPAVLRVAHRVLVARRRVDLVRRAATSS